MHRYHSEIMLNSKIILIPWALISHFYRINSVAYQNYFQEYCNLQAIHIKGFALSKKEHTSEPSALKWSKACFLKSPLIEPSSLYNNDKQI